jgi:Ca-activated chloride channel homolog
VGVGSENKAVLGYDIFGNPQYAEPVDENTLKEIAARTGGGYYRSVEEKTLQEVYTRIGKEIKREKEPTPVKDWFIAAAILILLAELILRYGPKRVMNY